jgi:hypothetical protein
MNFGNAIASIVISNFFDKNGHDAGHTRRSVTGAPGPRSRTGQRGSNSFAAHPERW